MKRRLAAAILTGVMAFGTLAGCGSSSSSSTSSGGASSSGSSTTSASSETKKNAEDINVTLIMSTRDEFRSTLEAGCIQAADEGDIHGSQEDEKGVHRAL